MATEPFFSICIPNFNYAGYVGETIQSVLNQTFTDFEVIVVDNASTDSSWEVIQQYAARDSRIRTHRNNCNVGFAPNLQKATERATGKFMILLSSDDLMYPEALQTYYDIILQKGDDIILHSAFYNVDSNGVAFNSGFRFTQGSYRTVNYREEQVKPEWTDGSYVVQGGYAIMKESLLAGISPAHFCTTCYPRALWLATEGYDLSYIHGPDTAFLYKLLGHNPELIYVRKRLFGYRVHNNNQTAQALMAGGVLKQQVDKYILSFSLGKQTLDNIRLSRAEVEKTFVQKYCVGQALSALKAGSWNRAFRLFCFGLATYPKYVFGSGKGWLLMLILLTGPLGVWAIRLVNKLRSK